MISIDREKVKEACEKIKDFDAEDRRELIEALGGREALSEIFDEDTLRFVCKSIYETGRLHAYSTPVGEDGLEVLEGLLNRNIKGDLGDFYNVKIDYIFSLPKKQKELIAKSFSQGVESLEKLLLIVWEKNIPTAACGGSNENAYILFRIPRKDIAAITRIGNAAYNQNLSSSFKVSKDICEIDIHAEGLEIYDKLLGEIESGDDLNKVNFFQSIINATADSYEAGKVQGRGDRTTLIIDHQAELREKNQEAEDMKAQIAKLEEEIGGLETKLEKEKKSHRTLKEKYKELTDKFLKVRDFTINRVGKIPFVGRRLLRAFEEEIGEKELSSGEENRGE